MGLPKERFSMFSVHDMPTFLIMMQDNMTGKTKIEVINMTRHSDPSTLHHLSALH